MNDAEIAMRVNAMASEPESGYQRLRICIDAMTGQKAEDLDDARVDLEVAIADMEALLDALIPTLLVSIPASFDISAP